MSSANVMSDGQLQESYTQLIHFAQMLPQLRRTNKSTGRPLWTDRSGDYQKDLGMMSEIIDDLLADISARVNNQKLMKFMFEVET